MRQRAESQESPQCPTASMDALQSGIAFATPSSPLQAAAREKESTVRGIVDIVSQHRFGTQMSLGRSTPVAKAKAMDVFCLFLHGAVQGGGEKAGGVAHLHLCSSVVVSPHQLSRIKPTVRGPVFPMGKA